MATHVEKCFFISTIDCLCQPGKKKSRCKVNKQRERKKKRWRKKCWQILDQTGNVSNLNILHLNLKPWSLKMNARTKI